MFLVDLLEEDAVGCPEALDTRVLMGLVSLELARGVPGPRFADATATFEQELLGLLAGNEDGEAPTVTSAILVPVLGDPLVRLLEADTGERLPPIANVEEGSERVLLELIEWHAWEHESEPYYQAEWGAVGQERALEATYRSTSHTTRNPNPVAAKKMPVYSAAWRATPNRPSGLVADARSLAGSGEAPPRLVRAA